MNTIDTVRNQIAAEASGNYDLISVVTVYRDWNTASKPVLVECSDREQYVIKGSQNGKMLYNEYVCARLGNLLGASVAWVRFVGIDPTLRASDPKLQHFGAGLALGSLRIPRASERAGIQYFDNPQNRVAFVSLAILYTWVRANDHQLIYQETPPNQVCSNDHGHFFPSGPNWTIASLAGEINITRDTFFDICKLMPNEFEPFWDKLNAITDNDIDNITKAPPVEWGVDTADRDALKNYLISRRGNLRAVFIS